MFSNLFIVLALIVAIATAASPDNVAVGQCQNFAIHGGSTVAFNGKETVIEVGDVGLSPGTNIPGDYRQLDGSTHINDTPANACANDRTTAYNDAKSRVCLPANKGNELSGLTLSAGVYCDAGAPLRLTTGDLTLHGSATDVFIFQASSSLLTSLNTKVLLTGEAKAENVFWAVGTSATLGTSSTFTGTLMTYASISFETDAKMNGQALAGAAVTFQSNNMVKDTLVNRA
eukprot:CAMPEP_0119040726 /NCGR_PEP_ID=MMETSP1177-20130426/10725_1 /TAXON_ID=2985 /ORGANISM="Ochromonas sp, Strain CCMP1899" /LENGTH=229 /DNA_ID=CAMNT_0007006039 /DNA_START=216 /DNA_END=905 /DNA_ORIENTATION=+